MKKAILVLLIILGGLCITSCKWTSKDVEQQESEEIQVDSVDYSLIEENEDL